jgi:hypothetical protein
MTLNSLTIKSSTALTQVHTALQARNWQELFEKPQGWIAAAVFLFCVYYLFFTKTVTKTVTTTQPRRGKKKGKKGKKGCSGRSIQIRVNGKKTCVTPGKYQQMLANKKAQKPKSTNDPNSTQVAQKGAVEPKNGATEFWFDGVSMADAMPYLQIAGGVLVIYVLYCLISGPVSRWYSAWKSRKPSKSSSAHKPAAYVMPQYSNRIRRKTYRPGRRGNQAVLRRKPGVELEDELYYMDQICKHSTGRFDSDQCFIGTYHGDEDEVDPLTESTEDSTADSHISSRAAIRHRSHSGHGKRRGGKISINIRNKVH